VSASRSGIAGGSARDEAAAARYAAVLGTGSYAPARVVTNAELEARLGEPVDDWLRTHVGIEQRHVMADDQVTSDLCVAAAQRALERAATSAADLDLVIVASDTPDYLSPGTASVVQHKLGARRAGTFDVNSACASWVTALDVGAKAIVADGDYRRVLVIGAYAMTRFLDWDDKRTATLFADGAGAVVLGPSARPGVLAAKLAAAGEYHDALGIYTGGSARPATAAAVAAHGRPVVQFVRKFPPTFNTERWPQLVRATLAKAGCQLDDVSLFLFTQLNLRTIEAVMDALAQPRAKAHWVMDRWGYTGSACVPMALDHAVGAGRVAAGDLIVLCASGGGIAMAAAALRWIDPGREPAPAP
jgi:3-oxoacyl-[acyl-carrier-protein] synthase-3